MVIATGIGTWQIYRISKKLRALFGESAAPDTTPQQDLIRRATNLELKMEEVDARMQTVEAISQFAVQKVGFLRFNPFSDTGGDNSFVIALLDRTDTGVLLSSLYTREGVRVYAKQVVNGRTKHLLSDEEKKVLEETLEKGIANHA